MVARIFNFLASTITNTSKSRGYQNDIKQAKVKNVDTDLKKLYGGTGRHQNGSAMSSFSPDYFSGSTIHRPPVDNWSLLDRW